MAVVADVGVLGVGDLGGALGLGPEQGEGPVRAHEGLVTAVGVHGIGSGGGGVGGMGVRGKSGCIQGGHKRGGGGEGRVERSG